MRDRLSKERRSWNMSRIRGKDTRPEKVVRSLLHRLGYRFRLHVRIPVPNSPQRRGDTERESKQRRPDFRDNKTSIPLRLCASAAKSRAVSVDILLPSHKTAIFVHGCFWHRHRGCKNCTTPTRRREWWLQKLEGNAARDKLHQHALQKLGWHTFVVWECETESPNALKRLGLRVAEILRGSGNQPRRRTAPALPGRSQTGRR
jgi:DNA mismatch endonuclease (patch repair protein)